MRYAVCAAVLVWCVGGAALAQEGAVPPAPAASEAAPSFRPRLERNPGAPHRAYMPPVALDQMTTGSALMCCTPRADRTLECKVAFEAPQGLGFGNAALALMSQMQITEESYAEYQTGARGEPFWQAQLFRLERRPEPPPLPPREERDALCRAASAD